MEALTEELGQHADISTESSPKDAEMIAELEEEVKDKEKEIKRLGDGWPDPEEKLMGLKNMMSWKVKEIKELKERVNMLEAEKLAEEERERNARA